MEQAHLTAGKTAIISNQQNYDLRNRSTHETSSSIFMQPSGNDCDFNRWDLYGDYCGKILPMEGEIMKPEAQRIAIAESVNYTFNGVTYDPSHPDWGYLYDSIIPDYLNDLNAMQSAEDALSSSVFFDYITELHKVVGGDYPETATAAQRAEAYLKIIGKWEDK